MKKNILIFILPLLIVFNGCSSFVEGYDESPNNPTEVTPPLLLTSAQIATMVTYSGQLARIATILTQQTAGTDFQLSDVANYTILEGNNVNEFANIYGKILMNSKELIRVAGEENPHYQGMAQVLQAFGYGIATDYWGDLPFTEALGGLEGSANFNPNYDSQETIIAGVQDLLDSAIANLSTTDDQNKLLPGSDDVIHGGDASAWIKTAWILKARYANKLSKKDASNSATAALSALDNAYAAGLASSADDANGQYGTNGNELNQWNAFLTERAGYIKMGEHFINLLNDLNDPRLPLFATPDTSGTNYSGTSTNSNSTVTSDVGAFFASATSPSPLATFTEAKFIEAEAALRSGDNERAATAYNDALAASFEMFGISDEAYLTANAKTAADIDLTAIMTQKHIAMFTQPEVWSDWRRTNIPALTPNPDGDVTGIPRRFPTPLSERVNNTNAQVTSDILAPVWWDE